MLIGTTVFAQANDVCSTKNTYILKPFDGPLTNPHKGFCIPTGGTWSFSSEWEYGPGGSKNNRAWDVVSQGSGYQRWDKLNPERGIYNWTDLDNLLDECQKHGMTYTLRVFPYSSSKGVSKNFTVETDYDMTPQWVYSQGARKSYATLPVNGNVYTLAVPVWDDPIYLQAHKDFAAALAVKYDGDPRVEYIDIRPFGNWGEWHVSHFEGTQMPSVEIQKDMLTYYASIFHKTLLVLPSSGAGEVYEHALSLGIAKRDDGLIATPKREYTLVQAYEANVPTIGENLSTYVTMLGYSDAPGGYSKWTLDRWKNVIKEGHLTYYVLDQDSDAGHRFYSDNKVHVDSMTKVLGYNFRITEAEMLATTESKFTTNTLNITVKNTGVAPCFFDAYMVAEFVDKNGSVLGQLGETIFIPKGTFKDEMVKEFEFSNTINAKQTNLATQQGVSVALSIYESENAYKSGKNPTVRFDNNGIQENNKLLLIPDGSSEVYDVKKNHNDFTSYVIGNTIYVTNVNGKNVCLYNSKGELCDKKKADMNDLQLTVNNKGVYYVVVDNQQDTIIVK